MSNVRIVFTSGNSWLARSIKFMTGDRFLKSARVNHVAFFVEEGDGTYVYEADWKGFVRTPRSKWKGNVVSCPALKKSIDDCEDDLKRWLGYPYDYPGLLMQIPVNVARWMGVKMRNPFRSARALICSEAGVRALYAANYPGCSSLDPEGTSPEALLDFMELP